MNKKIKKLLSLPFIFSSTLAAQQVNYADEKLTIDGIVSESIWQQQSWQLMDKHILGKVPAAHDFSGQYKLLWDEDYLYVLVKIIDDVLYDQHPDPLVKYWDDDCLEIFIDEDNSGGDHLANFNAFAYHIALDNQVVDYGPSNDGKGSPALFNNHLVSQWQRNNQEQGFPVYWEVAIKLYNDKYQHNSLNIEQYRVKNTENKTLGFMLAYCDNDGSAEREHFLGSHEITPINNDKNLGYKTADVFGQIKLLPPVNR